MALYLFVCFVNILKICSVDSTVFGRRISGDSFECFDEMRYIKKAGIVGDGMDRIVLRAEELSGNADPVLGEEAVDGLSGAFLEDAIGIGFMEM